MGSWGNDNRETYRWGTVMTYKLKMKGVLIRKWRISSGIYETIVYVYRSTIWLMLPSMVISWQLAFLSPSPFNSLCWKSSNSSYPVLYAMGINRVQELDEDCGRRGKDSEIKIECKVIYGHRTSSNLQQLGAYDHSSYVLEMHREWTRKRKFLWENLPLTGLLPDCGDLQKTQMTLSHHHHLQSLLRSSRKGQKSQWFGSFLS